MKFVNLSDIAIPDIKGTNYCCIISLISKNEAINLFQNADLTEKEKHYKVKNIKAFESAYKNGKSNYKIW